MKKKSGTDKKGSAGQSFLHGALILTAGMAVVKIIGALFKIPLKYAVGEYGMGLFNVAYNFYGPVFSLATAGFPVAVSRMVSENRSLGRWNDVRQVRRTAFPLFLAFGGTGMVLMTLFAPFYCETIIDSPHALAPVLALAPAILFACLGSVYRGYYEGLQNMAPTAVSEVAEALVKLILGVIRQPVGRFFLHRGICGLRHCVYPAAGLLRRGHVPDPLFCRRGSGPGRDLRFRGGFTLSDAAV